jgi:hypothetical protein
MTPAIPHMMMDTFEKEIKASQEESFPFWHSKRESG